MSDLRSSKRCAESGFSLIEVVITIGILMSLTLAVASMLRGGFDVKAGLSQQSKVAHRLQIAMQRVVDDLQHAYMLSPKVDKGKINFAERKMKALFKIDKGGNKGDKLQVTTKTHRAMIAGRHESDLSFVTYELQEARDVPGRMHLYRGSFPYIPADLREEPHMRLLARNIKNITFEPWTGDRWSKDYWDSGRGDTRNALPRMVRVTIEAWAEDREEGDGRDESYDQRTETLSTVVYIYEAAEYAELKQPDKSIRWGNM